MDEIDKIAWKVFFDACEDPFIKDAGLALMKRIEGKEKSAVGQLISEAVHEAYNAGKNSALQSGQDGKGKED